MVISFLFQVSTNNESDDKFLGICIEQGHLLDSIENSSKRERETCSRILGKIVWLVWLKKKNVKFRRNLATHHVKVRKSTSIKVETMLQLIIRNRRYSYLL